MKRSIKYIAHILLTGCLALMLSCQSPVKTVEQVPTTVMVVIRDQNALPMPGIPVEAHKGTVPGEGTLLQSRVTDANGQSLFSLTVPADGDVYTIVAGNAQ